MRLRQRSHLTIFGEIRRGFIDIGRYRYMFHKIDMEPWRDRVCPVCKSEFANEPTFYFDGLGIHNDCTFTPAYEKWVNQQYDKYEED